jgi:predicted  nucleic acid-binding Zn-ribbon protein
MELLKLDQCLSDEGEIFEDTFRPSLFKRIDSESSIQSNDFSTPSMIDTNLPINPSNLLKQFDRDYIWELPAVFPKDFKDSSFLTDLQCKNSSFELESLQRKEKLTTDKLKEALNKNQMTQEQYSIEVDYLKSKINYLEQRVHDLNEKCSCLENKNEDLNKDLLEKDKRIIWLENENFVKDVKIKTFVGLEDELGEMKRFKETNEILKGKIQICEAQLASLRKDKKEIASGFNVELAKLNDEKERITRNLDALSKKYERTQEALKGNNDVVKKLQEERDNLIFKSKNGDYVNSGKDRVVVKSVMNILKLSSEEDIMPKLENLLKIKNYEKLVKKLSQLVTDCSPPGTFPTPPSTTLIWKFLRRVMETYIEITKSNTSLQRFLGQLSSLSSLEEVHSALSQIPTN